MDISLDSVNIKSKKAASDKPFDPGLQLGNLLLMFNVARIGLENHRLLGLVGIARGLVKDIVATKPIRELGLVGKVL